MELRTESKEILSIVQKQGPLTKNAIKELTGYTLTSLNRFFKPLLDLELIQQVGHNESDGGRPSTLFDIDTRHFGLIGIDISRTYCTIILCNLKMEIQKDDHFFIHENTDPTQLINWLIHTIRHLQTNSGYTLLGIGIGTIGPVDIKTGAFLNPEHFPNHAFEVTNFYEALNLAIDLPITIDSGARSALRYESLFGEAKNYTNTAYINCGVSIRDSVLINRTPISDGLAYENKLAHMTILYGDRNCTCGNKGCVEAYSSLSGMAKYYNSKHNTHLNYQTFLTSTEFNLQLQSTIYKGAEILGIGIANYIRMFSLDYVIIGGPLVLNNDSYYTNVLKHTLEHMKNAPTKQVMFSKGGSSTQFAMAIGGACTFFETYL